MIKIGTAEPEFFYSPHSSSFSKHGTYITQNATYPLSDITEGN